MKIAEIKEYTESGYVTHTLTLDTPKKLAPPFPYSSNVVHWRSDRNYGKTVKLSGVSYTFLGAIVGSVNEIIYNWIPKNFSWESCDIRTLYDSNVWGKLTPHKQGKIDLGFFEYWDVEKLEVNRHNLQFTCKQVDSGLCFELFEWMPLQPGKMLRKKSRVDVCLTNPEEFKHGVSEMITNASDYMARLTKTPNKVELF